MLVRLSNSSGWHIIVTEDTWDSRNMSEEAADLCQSGSALYVGTYTIPR